MKRFVLKLFNRQCHDSTDDIDGGVRTRIDSNAPKTIHCTKLVSLECTFSTLSLMNTDEVERSVFTLTAKLEGETVNAAYKSRKEEFVFSAVPSFMDCLQSIVAEYDFAQFNGITYRVSGLPDMYGAVIHAKYESGEDIYSSNNQDCFIPLEAIKKLLSLYKKHKA